MQASMLTRFTLGGVFLIVLLCPCTGFSSSDTLVSISPFNEPGAVDTAIESTEPLSPVGPFVYLRPGSSVSVGLDEGPLQVAIANIPPMPSESEESVGTIADPLESVNRAFFKFNDKLYFRVLKPVASGYKAVVHQDVRVGVRNFFSNVSTPIRLVNCLLQAKFECSGTEALRFLVNTTFGLAGFLDPAKTEFHMKKRETDLGTTLGFWGIGSVFYINWPILGPSSLRDTVGYVGDLFLDPQTYLITSIPINLGVRSYYQVNETSLTIGEYEDFKEAALDPYIALREAYHQYREGKIKASKAKNGGANPDNIDNSKQSTEFKESRRAEVITQTPPLEAKMKKYEQVPSNVEEKSDSSAWDKKIVTVSWTFVMIRSGARNDYPIVTTANQGDKLIVTGELGEWFHVRLESGEQGWVSNGVVK